MLHVYIMHICLHVLFSVCCQASIHSPSLDTHRIHIDIQLDHDQSIYIVYIIVDPRFFIFSSYLVPTLSRLLEQGAQIGDAAACLHVPTPRAFQVQLL